MAITPRDLRRMPGEDGEEDRLLRVQQPGSPGADSVEAEEWPDAGGRDCRRVRSQEGAVGRCGASAAVSAAALALVAVAGLVALAAASAAGYRGRQRWAASGAEPAAGARDSSSPVEQQEALIDEFTSAGCAAPSEKRCFEGGKLDRDCCAMPGQGHCEEGFAFIEGGVCYKNGARRTCCMAPRHATDGHCAYPEEQKCKEYGHPDNDCCAMPGHGSCVDGYKYSEGKVCFKALGAVKTCCKKDDGSRGPGPPPEEACAASGENCEHSQCCKDKGFQCYRKNSAYASCSAACPASWDCEALGPRTPDDSTPAGSWPGENCGWTRRCNMRGMTCFVKNEYFATCKENCSKGERDSFDKKSWDCERLGGFDHQKALAAAPAGERTAGASLFCVLVASTANTATTHEDVLLDYQRRQNLGIFACEASVVHWAPKAPRGTWQSVANVGIFVDIWNKIRDAGEYKHHDWVVKVDPDTVWFPDRLKRHLLAMRIPAGVSVYLENCDFKFRFQGSFEVVSSAALEKYLDAQELCVKHIGTSGGEDAFFQTCMAALGIGHMKDVSLLNDKYTWDSDYEMNDVAFCADSWRAAFHPLKTPELWQACKHAAEAAIPNDNVKRLRK